MRTFFIEPNCGFGHGCEEFGGSWTKEFPQE